MYRCICYKVSAQTFDQGRGLVKNKPHWLNAEEWATLLRKYDGVPRCDETGETEDLDVDHIVPRARGGSNDTSNLRFLARRLNAIKGPRPDRYWSQEFYWDQVPNVAVLRGAQKILWSTIVDEAEWFGQPAGYTARVLYTNIWTTGAGKTLGIPVAAWAYNQVQRNRWGTASRRADRILILTKETAVRDQIAADLASDITDYGVCDRPPRVGILDKGHLLTQDAWLDEHDAVVACVQLFWDKQGGNRTDLPQVLAKFPLIAFDEPHFGADQIRDLVDMAETSVCFGFTGTPIDSAGKLLDRMVRLTTYSYQQADELDRSMKYLDGEEEHFRQFVRELDINEAQVRNAGLDVVDHDTRRQGYGKNIAPMKAVVRDVVRALKERDEIGLSGGPAIHRRTADDVVVGIEYPAHGMIVCDGVKTAKMLCDNINEIFDRDRDEYPREKGWAAAVVHTDDGDGKGQPLRQDHPWLRARRHGMDKKCARVLFVVGMGREGVNNPYCSVVGAACSTESQVEVLQRWFGRQARAVTEMRDGVLFVAAAPLDTMLLVTHAAFNNGRIIRKALAFAMDIEGHVSPLPTIEELRNSNLPALSKIERDALLPQKERLAIAGIVGAAVLEGETIPADSLVREFAPMGSPKEERVRDFVRTLERDPDEARTECRLNVQLKHIPGVIREYLAHDPTDEDLEIFIRTRHQDMAEYLPLEGANRKWALKLHKEESERFQLPPISSPYENLTAIRKSLAGRVRVHLGRHLAQTDRDVIWPLVGGAVKQVLGVPEAESARDGSDWDIPAWHAILVRPEVQRDIIGWVVGRLIDAGCCPTLAAVFGQASE